MEILKDKLTHNEKNTITREKTASELIAKAVFRDLIIWRNNIIQEKENGN